MENIAEGLCQSSKFAALIADALLASVPVTGQAPRDAAARLPTRSQPDFEKQRLARKTAVRFSYWG
jgi:hypothetical protein